MFSCTVILTSAWYLQGSTILSGHVDALDLQER